MTKFYKVFLTNRIYLTIIEIGDQHLKLKN